ncbi:MAG: hypothetical protein HGGPFJEG_00531 [Ignavibacteria bacterium]|nr:hypothetical protein [Ignavibacteria bacterium]
MKIKKIKLTLITSIMLIAYSGIAFAQNQELSKKSPEEIATKITDKMKDMLLLTDEQYKQIYNLNLEQINSKINNKEKYKNLDKESKKNLKRQMKEEYNKSLENILTSDQINIYKKYITDKKSSKKRKNE